MIKTFLSILLAGLLVVSVNSPALAAQSNDDAQAISKIQIKVAKMGVGEKAKVTVKMKNGTKVKGFISQAGTDDFTVRDRQTGDPTTIAYRDVLKVESNRGHSTATNIALGVAIGVGAFLAVIALVFANLND